MRALSAGERRVLVGVVVGDLADDADLLGECDGCVLVAQLDLRDGAVVPEGIEVGLEILVLIGEAVARLTDLALGGVGVHQQTQVFLLRETALDLDAL